MTVQKIAVVVPAYKVSSHILDVLREIGPEVSNIYVVDDACPEASGKLVQAKCNDSRVKVIFHDVNQGVGGATVSGYRAAIDSGVDVIVKLDGDGQMDPSKIKDLIAPIVSGNADYTKGNRFDSLTGLKQMPNVRVFGNGILSLMSKVASGYWGITDPTNGFTAIHSQIAKALPLEMVSKRFFFESDLLFRLSLARAVVVDVAMDARYGSEKSNLSVFRAIFEFPRRHFVNFHKRLFYNYYLRDMTAASIELPLGIFFSWFGAIFGLVRWRASQEAGHPATAGTVMIAAISIILGVQLILGFLNQDIANEPRRVRHKNY